MLSAGGIKFTVPLLLLALAILGLMAFSFVRPDRKRIGLVLHLGVFSAVFGILGQTIGLLSALDAIEAMGGVSPAMLAGGLKVSFITTIFGLANLTMALAGWTVLRYRAAD